MVRALGLHYAVGVESKTKVWRADGSGAKRGHRISLLALARRLRLKGRGFRRVTWREGTDRSLWSRFAVERVVPSPHKRRHKRDPEAVWLLFEWPDGEPEPINYFFVSLAGLSRKQMVRLVKERYRTEAAYQELKGELGLDHFEGRRFRGWHHHVSMVLCCHAFLVAERASRFSPRPQGRRKPIRSYSRPERHFPDSARTARLAIARQIVAAFLPRCPTCHHPSNREGPATTQNWRPARSRSVGRAEGGAP